MAVRKDQSIATYGYADNQWWTFDDTCSLGKKAYVKGKVMLGVMVWEMSSDAAGGVAQHLGHRVGAVAAEDAAAVARPA
ncbi:glycoside hydrolase family 18 protein [Streptomyces sp. NPDC005146]